MCNFLVLELEESIFTRLSRFVFKFINFKMAFLNAFCYMYCKFFVILNIVFVTILVFYAYLSCKTCF